MDSQSVSAFSRANTIADEVLIESAFYITGNADLIHRPRVVEIDATVLAAGVFRKTRNRKATSNVLRVTFATSRTSLVR